MTDVPVPRVGDRITIGFDGGETYQTRVDHVGGDVITVTTPLDVRVTDLPEVDTVVTVSWAGQRGRHKAASTVIGITTGPPGSWRLRLTGTVQVQQQRQFVRGGGGEPLTIRRLGFGGGTFSGYIVDLSEGGVRGRFQHLELHSGEHVAVRFALEDTELDLPATVLRVADQPALRAIDVVAILNLDEAQATAIRRYILQAQLRARQAAAV
ncbi:PilZ domain-containing protein [Pilimelia columellifera]|uniref:PilZ domain-containing protein n=1 Tax=Pilimelia columellifera subsp. columellifera TaxID=706583 RepID=A0ABP6AVI2_9ACTN